MILPCHCDKEALGRKLQHATCEFAVVGACLLLARYLFQCLAALANGAAMKKEWDNLSNKGVWDLSGVRPKAKVKAEIRADPKRKAHFGRVFGICVEKGSELDINDENRKMKGRYVFQGNDVRDQNAEIAVFDSLSSSPATMEGSRAVDAYGAMRDNVNETGDAEQAYVQTLHKGQETWVVLPEKFWKTEWSKLGYKRPVVRLVKALYGHPNAGAYWEEHCNDILVNKLGWMQIHRSSMFWHPIHKTLLMV